MSVLGKRVSQVLKRLLNEENDHQLLEDESMIRDYLAIQKAWFF